MKFSIFKEGFIILAIFVLGWVAISQFDIFPEEVSLDVSVEKEEELGEVLTDAYLADQNVIEVTGLDTAIRAIEYRLIQGLDSTEYNYNIVVVEDPSINAFATLGGNIVIFTGLIDFAEEPEELAAVMAHEMGHVEHKHVVNKLIREVGITVLLSIISGGDPSIVQEMLKMLASSGFSRLHEKEADQFALELMEKSNIDPEYLGQFFERIDEEMGGYAEELEIFMSHPHNQARIDASYSYKTDDDFEEEAFDMDWESVKGAMNEAL